MLVAGPPPGGSDGIGLSCSPDIRNFKLTPYPIPPPRESNEHPELEPLRCCVS